jgi:hypothetical protein
MKDGRDSLRVQIEKWFGAAQPTAIQISRSVRSLPGTARSVSVSRPRCPYVIVFFQHGDGSWRVYPPSVSRPALNALRAAA